ncbi:transposase [Streptomyces sp. NBC_01278]|nr:transposase [Streptomyces sp. NBC_01278]
MAERLGVDHQQLQQFMTSSTWPIEDVRARLAWRAVRAVRPQVWVVDDTGFRKDGKASAGVARQYSGTWARWATVRSASASTPLPIPLRARWPGVCSCPQPGTARRRPAAGRPAGSPRTSITSRNGGSHWTCSTNSPAPGFGPQPWSRTPATARTRISATAWKTADWATSFR